MADEHDIAGEAQVGDLRLRIDQIDDQLMKLLNSRSACAVEIGRIKRRIGMPVYQPDREKWILDRVERNNPGPLDSGALRRVFERVIDESRRLERLAGEAEDGQKEKETESMVIVMEHSASEEQVQKVIESLVEVGYDVHRSSGVDFTVLGAVGVPHKPDRPAARSRCCPGCAR